MTIVGVIGNVRGTAVSIADPASAAGRVYLPAAGLGQRYFAHSPPNCQRNSCCRSSSMSYARSTRNRRWAKRIRWTICSASTRLQPRLNMALLVSFAAIALALACVGIYGVVAYSVAQRRQEIGVRMALGASHSQIASLFLKRTLTSALIGLACGGVATLLLTRLLRSQLYGVQPNDPMTFLIATLLLLAPVFAASLRPALKAASVDPMEALRTE